MKDIPTRRIIPNVLKFLFCSGTPRGFDYTGVQRDLAGLAGVTAVHSVHVWSLTMDKHVVTAHLAVGMWPLIGQFKMLWLPTWRPTW